MSSRLLKSRDACAAFARIAMMQAIDEGVDIVTISKRIEHAKPDITLRIYPHLFRKDDGRAAAAIKRGVESPGCQSGANFVVCSVRDMR